MHETLRRRILRRLEGLPETQLYQVLDYIEFLESRYGAATSGEASGLQTLAERLEDGLRRRTLSPSALREAFQLVAAADRVLTSVSDVGRELLADLQLSQEWLDADSRTPLAAPPTPGARPPATPPTPGAPPPPPRPGTGPVSRDEGPDEESGTG